MADGIQPGETPRLTESVPATPSSILQSPTQPTLDERTMAILAHLLQIVGLWVAPLIILLVKRESKFVSFHALEALLFQICYLFLMGLGVFFWFGAIILAMISAHATGEDSSPPAFMIFMPMLWLDWMCLWGAMVVIAIVYGVKAGRGEWAEYPFLGRLALRILKLGPGGAPKQESSSL
jgi:uncharacterized Tic20 family protein